MGRKVLEYFTHSLFVVCLTSSPFIQKTKNKKMSGEYKCTTDSKNPQTRLWPDCLPKNDHRLFIIERSKNANLVVYDAKYNHKGELDPANPVDVYWQDYAVSSCPPREDLGWMEKKMAYGYDFEKGNSPNEFFISLKALSGKNLRKGRLFVDENKLPQAMFVISGKEARILKIYVSSTETMGFIPTVNYVDIYGFDPVSKQDVYERLTV
eukprot:TRINITY_DN2398_c0_g1_i1.p1 TRINITY_DN2398_c0_g1~~TRINITY_DN2398_c0_g1_i1.p1  ORF type:complete len:209 (+),score=37.30 TRINITY_DN2398_c0_g1_i1:51-677(+)